jgi:hypothetical protein
MKIYISIVFLFFYCNILFSQNNKVHTDTCQNINDYVRTQEELEIYIENPCPTDYTCIEDIISAKSAIQKGEIYFFMPFNDMSSTKLRQEIQLGKLCTANGLIFMYESFGCLRHTGEIKECFSTYMDKIIVQKFGKDFKSNLLKQADSLYLSTNPTVPYYHCDNIPKLPKKDLDMANNFQVILSKDFINKIDISEFGYYPEVYIDFLIDKQGVPSKYCINHFFDHCETKENEKYEYQLCTIALDFIKQFKTWLPGTVLDQKVNTLYNIKISFISGE